MSELTLRRRRHRPPPPHPWIGLAGFLVLSFAASALGGVFSAEGTWYEALRKPAWNPPGWLFGPVWTALYAAMAVAAWLVWRRGGFGGARTALVLWCVQLALNAAWSPLFFGARRPDLALVCIVAMWGAIAATTVAFRRIRPAAAALMLPYLAWVTFATALNFAIWRMN